VTHPIPETGSFSQKYFSIIDLRIEFQASFSCAFFALPSTRLELGSLQANAGECFFCKEQYSPYFFAFAQQQQQQHQQHLT
jgi:hypothetical protein